MKKTLFALLLSLMVLPAMANPEPELIDIARAKVAQSNLINIGAGLDLWQKNHGGVYPTRLSDLEPNYLFRVPKAPTQDWIYRRGSDGRSFIVEVAGQPFEKVALPGTLSFSSESGLRPVLTNPDPRLVYRLVPPTDFSVDWKHHDQAFERSDEWITASLEGPWTISQTAEDWTRAAVEEFRSRPGATVHLERPIAFGELSGTEMEGTWLKYRIHSYFLTDGQAGWTFDYTARADKFSPEIDAMFQEMVRSRVRGE